MVCCLTCRETGCCFIKSVVCCGVSCVEKLGAALLNQWCVVLRVEKLGAALLNQCCSGVSYVC